MTLDGSSITTSGSGTQLTFDAEGDINLDSNSGVIAFKDNATSILNIANSFGDVINTVSELDKNFTITAMMRW